MAGLEYIKAALVDGDTVVKGGLILSTLIALRNDKGNVTAGINGADTKENGIALWLGGKAIDKQASTTTEEEKKIAAKSLLRFDGTGYFANGNLWWDADGILHADPTSFIINKNNIGVQLALFAPVWKSGTTDTTKLANVLSIDPQKPFTHLDVSGNVTTEGSLKIGGIYLSYDSANNALRLSKDAAGKEAANFYATGGITAYGAGASTTGGGGGLNGSVKSYSNALKLTSESLSEIASAYSIKALDSRISSLEGGSATAISVSGSGNAVTSVTKNGTTISVVKGSTFLTSHQSLDGYVNAISVSGSGNAITSVSKSGKGITFTKGSTFLTSHQSLSAYLKSADAANTYLKLSGGAMTGNIRYKGSKSTYDMITFVDNNADTYGNGICIGGGGLTIVGGGESANAVLSQHTSGGDEYMIVANDAAIDFFSNLQNGWNSRKAGSFDTSGYWNGAGFKKDNSSDSYVLLGGGGHKAISSLSVNYASSAGSASSVAWSNVSGRPTKVSQFTNDNGYITSSGSCAYATSAGNADKVDGVHVTWAGVLTSTSHLVAWESDGSALRDINPANVTVGNSDKLDGIHANGLLTALSNSDKGISITVGGTTKSISNISVNYASSAGNADTVDNEHASAFTRIVGRHTILTKGTAPYKYIHLFRIANSNGYSTLDCEIDIRTRYHSAKIEIRISTNEHPYNNGGSSISIVKKVVSGRTCNLWVLPTVQSSNYNYYDVYYESGAWNGGSYGITLKGNNGNLVFEHKGTNLTSLPDKVSPVSNNVAVSATKLQTPKTIWGQSFDGTGNVNGTIYINNSDSENGAIILNNNVNANARISAIKDQVVFNTGAAIRFGAVDWEYSDWAGLKYDTVANAIYLGIADGTVFNYYSNKRSNGTLKFPGITTITPDSGARIGGSGGDLYLGNANNTNWVKVQDMCSQVDSNNWKIMQGGYALFKDITIINTATINGSTHINNLLTAKGIMPTTADVNAFGTNVKNWDGSIAANVTNMFNGIPLNNIQVEYSMDNGASWNTYPGNPENRFNLVNDNARVFNYF